MRNEHLDSLGNFRCYTTFVFYKSLKVWNLNLKNFWVVFLVLVFCCLRRLRLCLSCLLFFPTFPRSQCLLNFRHHTSSSISSLAKTQVLTILLCALIIIQFFHLHLVTSILLMLHLFLVVLILLMLHFLITSVLPMLHRLAMSIQTLLCHQQLFLTQRGKN